MKQYELVKYDIAECSSAMEMRAKTLMEVKNDLESRLEELV